MRGDDKTFSAASRLFTADVNDPASGVATAAREQREICVEDVSTLQRAALAEEFDIKRISFVPVASGVLEYGIPTNTCAPPLASPPSSLSC